MDAAWDLSKENIQPIAQGRKIDILEEAIKSLSIKDNDRKKMLEQESQQYIARLEENKDDSDQRLSIWHEYIDWIEQNYPQGGNVAKLSEAIESCIEEFYNQSKFKQDTRLFDVFMKFKRFCNDPLEIFNFMRANGICTLLASFYISWAWQYDIRNNVKKADEILELGINTRASPISLLTNARDCLQYRIVKAMMNGDAEEFVSSTNETDTTNAALATGGIRKALQSLKIKTSDSGVAKISVNRVGDAVNYHDVGGLKNQIKVINGVKTIVKAMPKQNGSEKSITVFADENISAEDREILLKMKFPAPIPTSQRAVNVGKTGAENQVKSTKFTEPGAKLSVSRTIRVRTSRAAPAVRRERKKEPQFTIFEDN